MAVRSLRFVLTGEDKNATKTFTKVGKSADTLGSKIGGIGKKTALGVGGIGLGLGAAVVALGPKVYGLAASMEALDAKAQTVFGKKALGTVQKWAGGNAAAMGLSQKEAVGLAAGFADLLIPMGFTRDQAAKMSTDVVGLSGALAEWSGGMVSASGASDILAKAMLGETDGLKSLGIAISAADIEARLLRNGTNKLKGAQLAQAKATATQQLIFEKSADAQTAYKNGSETLARKQAELTAEFKTLRDKGIAALTPYLKDFAGYLTDTAVPAVEKLAEGFKNGTGTGGEIRDVLGEVKTVVTDVGGVLNDTLVPVLRFVADNKDAFGVMAKGVLAYYAATKLAAVGTAAFAFALGQQAAGQAAVAATAGGATGGGKGGKVVPLLGVGGLIGGAGLYAQDKLPGPLGKTAGSTKTRGFNPKTGEYLTQQGKPTGQFAPGFGPKVPIGPAVPIRGKTGLSADRTIVVNVQVDKRTIASAVVNGNAKNARRGAKTAPAR